MIDFRLWLVLTLSALATLLPAQDLFELGGITISGCEYTDPQSVQKLTGLRIGQRLLYPEQVNQAVAKLSRQKLFKDVTASELRRTGTVLFLEFEVEEYPRLENWSVSGLTNWQKHKLTSMLTKHLQTGITWSPNREQQLRTALQTYWQEAGRASAKVDLSWQNNGHLNLMLQPGPKYRINEVQFTDQGVWPKRRLHRVLSSSSTKRWWKSSVYNPVQLEADRKALEALFQEAGYLDAKVKVTPHLNDTKAKVKVNFNINPGARYTYGPIRFSGNVLFPDALLLGILDIQPGTPFHLARLEEKLYHSPDGRDISGLYLDNGFLFMKLEPVQEWLGQQQIGLHIRITEGRKVRVGKVAVEGNERTHEAVIRRELATRPGTIFSRAAILESQRRLMSMGYFNPEAMGVNTKVTPKAGTVDVTYEVEEKRGDKWELSANWDPQSNRLVGTVGLQFQNFSFRNLIRGGAWDPIPSGEGQQLSLRLQSTGARYQGINFSFSEPWLGGKKPNLFSVAGYHQRYTNGLAASDACFGSLSISGGSLTLGKRIRIGGLPVAFSTELSYQHIHLNQYQEISLDDGSTVSEGRFNNLYLKPQLTYSNANDRFFPTQGWMAEASAQFTLPYQQMGLGGSPDARYLWLSYHKWQLKLQGFQKIGSKLVLMGGLKMGAITGYDGTTPPFERFELGGNGIGSMQAAFLGNDIISMRGYDEADFPVTESGGGGAFAKVTAELRYPVLNQGGLRGYILGFAEIGNIWSNARQITPFDLRPAAGIGFRLQVPMLGTIGLDYGLGFDRPELQGAHWHTYGRFNFILGFEPE